MAQVFPVNFVKFLRTPFLQNTSGRLLLSILIRVLGFSVVYFSVFINYSVSLLLLFLLLFIQLCYFFRCGCNCLVEVCFLFVAIRRKKLLGKNRNYWLVSWSVNIYSHKSSYQFILFTNLNIVSIGHTWLTQSRSNWAQPSKQSSDSWSRTSQTNFKEIWFYVCENVKRRWSYFPFKCKSVFVRQNDTTSIFLCLSKVWGVLHHGSVGQVQNKESHFMLSFTFLAFFCFSS